MDKARPGKFGFIDSPPLTAGGVTDAMSASDLQVIPLKASHHTQAAAFLDFIQTNPTARQDSSPCAACPRWRPGTPGR